MGGAIARRNTFERFLDDFSAAYNDVSVCYFEPDKHRIANLISLLQSYHQIEILEGHNLEHLKTSNFIKVEDVYTVTESIYDVSKKAVGIGIITILGDVLHAFIGKPPLLHDDRDSAKCIKDIRKRNVNLWLSVYEHEKTLDSDTIQTLKNKIQDEHKFHSFKVPREMAAIAWTSLSTTNTVPADYSLQTFLYELQNAHYLRCFLIICYRKFCTHGKLPTSSIVDEWKTTIVGCTSTEHNSQHADNVGTFQECYDDETNSYIATIVRIGNLNEISHSYQEHKIFSEGVGKKMRKHEFHSNKDVKALSKIALDGHKWLEQSVLTPTYTVR